MEIEVLMETQQQKNADEEIKRKEADRFFLRSSLGGDTQTERRLKAEIEDLKRKAKEDEVTTQCFKQAGWKLQAEFEVLRRKATEDGMTVRGDEKAEQKLKAENQVLQRKAKEDEVTIRGVEQAERSSKADLEVSQTKAKEDEVMIRGVGQAEQKLKAEIEVLRRKAKEDEVTIQGIEQAERKLKSEIEVLQRRAKEDEVTIRCFKQAWQRLQAEFEVLRRKAKEDGVTVPGDEKAEQKLKAENQVLQRKAKEDEVTIRSLQRLSNETSEDSAILKEILSMQKSALREQDMEIERKLSENLLAEASRNEGEANKSRFEEAHRLECVELRFKAQQAEVRSQSLSIELYLLKKSVEKDHSGTRLRSAERMCLAVGAQKEDGKSSLTLKDKMEPEATSVHKTGGKKAKFTGSQVRAKPSKPSPPALPPPKEEKERLEDYDAEHGDSFCGSCGGYYTADQFWILCDSCEKWFHGECVKITPERAEQIKYYSCPSCRNKRARKTWESFCSIRGGILPQVPLQ